MSDAHTALHTEICAVRALTPATTVAMLALMNRVFAQVRAAQFHQDLARKQWVIMLHDHVRGTLAGFSTLAQVQTHVQATPVSAFFSGDTVIDPAYWGTPVLATAWLRFVFAQVQAQPVQRWFWFLICKGFRTYRYLPVYFQEYYPHPDHATPPFEQAVLDGLGQQLFDGDYDRARGVITCPDDYCLRCGIGDIGPRELRDRRTAFFHARNPAWTTGAELACLTELRLDNLRLPGRRALARTPGPTA